MRYTLARIGLLLGLLAALIAPTIALRGTGSAAAAVTLSTTDRLLAPARGTPEKVARYAEATGATRPLDTRRYLDEIYRLAPLVGLDPAIVVAQSALETATWTSFYWTEHLNPAGLRITASGVRSYTWATGTAAARYHLVHLYTYAAGAIDPANPLYPYRADGPGYQNALNLGYGGIARTIDDLTGRWAVDPDYAAKIVSRGNGIFAPAATDPVDPRVTTVVTLPTEGGTAAYATDGDLATSWSVVGVGGPPAGAALTLDLGRSHRVSSIRWMFGTAGRADRWSLQMSGDGAVWSTLDTYSNAAERVWQIHTASGSGRYVRFLLANPTGDAKLGGIAEVEVYGAWAEGAPPATATPYPIPTATGSPIATGTPTAVATPTRTPPPTATPTPTVAPSPAALEGEPLPIIASGGSRTGNGSRHVRDGDLRTTWQTISVPAPSRSRVYVDLGRVRSITGVEWLFRRTSGAGSYAIQVSTDKSLWITVSGQTGSTPLAWQRVALAVEARYVRFAFDGTRQKSQAGYLAEIVVYGDAVTTGGRVVGSEVILNPMLAEATSTAVATVTAAPTAPVATPTSTPEPISAATPVIPATNEASPVSSTAG